jgi:hypothetical protein
MPRRHKQHEAIDLATLYSLKLSRNLIVQRRRTIARERRLREAN